MSTLVEPATRTAKPPPRWALTLPQVWAVVAVVLPMLVVESALGTVDLAYHLRAGDLMLGSRAFLRTDTFSFTAAGHSWLNQQWGAQIMLASVFKGLGWAGLALIHAFLVGLVALFVYLACRARKAPARIAASVSLAAFAVSFVNLSLRPQLLGMVLFTLTLWFVVDRQRHPGRLLVVPAIVAIWANVHGSFFLGPLMVGLAWLEDLHERRPEANRTMLVGAASAVATLFNPFGPRIWSYALSLSTNAAVTAHVSEWQSPSIRGPGGALFFVSVGLVAIVLARRERRVPWPSIVWLGTFFAVGLTAVRSTPWWTLAAAPVVAGLLRSNPARPRKELPASGLNSMIALLIVVPALAFFPWSLVGRPLAAPGRQVADAPSGLTNALERVLAPRDRIFNAQIWGSWFELTLPHNPVFVDSRIEVFPDSVWEQYRAVSSGRQGWQAILDRWKVRAVAIFPGQQEPLIPLIRRDPHWTLVYEDDDGLIFLRR